MKYFTPEELKPSEKTLNMIRQIAHCYKSIQVNGQRYIVCLNYKQNEETINCPLIALGRLLKPQCRGADD